MGREPMLKDRYEIVVSGKWLGQTLNVADHTFNTVERPDPNTWLMREAETGEKYELARLVSTICELGSTPDWNCRLSKVQ